MRREPFVDFDRDARRYTDSLIAVEEAMRDAKTPAAFVHELLLRGWIIERIEDE